MSNKKILSRLFRAEVHYYKTLKNNRGICIAKKWIFLENKIYGYFEKVFTVKSGSRPLSVCESLDGALFFGEYFNNKERREVKIYALFNDCKTWENVYTFPRKSIRQIHNIQMDPFTGFLWIVTGV